MKPNMISILRLHKQLAISHIERLSFDFSQKLSEKCPSL